MRSVAFKETRSNMLEWNSWGRVSTTTLALFALTVMGWGNPRVTAAQESGALPSNSNDYALETKIPLPGPAGHGDWVAYDPGTGYIYLSHHGSNLVVVDPRSHAVIANIQSPNLKTPDVMAFDSKYVYVTAEDAGRLVVISKKDWKVVGSVKTKGGSPDGIWENPVQGKLYIVSNAANQLDVYESGSQPRLIATYPLRPVKPVAGPDVGTLVPSKRTLYEPDDAMVLAIDSATGQITGILNTHLKIGKNGAAKSMAYDPKTNRLWVATTDRQVLILDADMLMQITATKATEPDDEIGFDPGQRLVYVFGGHGFDTYNADTMQHVAYVDTGSGITHTGTVDPVTHEVYVYEGQANVLGVYAKR